MMTKTILKFLIFFCCCHIMRAKLDGVVSVRGSTKNPLDDPYIIKSYSLPTRPFNSLNISRHISVVPLGFISVIAVALSFFFHLHFDFYFIAHQINRLVNGKSSTQFCMATSIRIAKKVDSSRKKFSLTYFGTRMYSSEINEN